MSLKSATRGKRCWTDGTRHDWPILQENAAERAALSENLRWRKQGWIAEGRCVCGQHDGKGWGAFAEAASLQPRRGELLAARSWGMCAGKRRGAEAVAEHQQQQRRAKTTHNMHTTRAPPVVGEALRMRGSRSGQEECHHTQDEQHCPPVLLL